MTAALVAVGLLAVGPTVTSVWSSAGAVGANPLSRLFSRSIFGGARLPTRTPAYRSNRPLGPVLPLGPARATSISSDWGRGVAVLTSGGAVLGTRGGGAGGPGRSVWRAPSWAAGATALAVVNGGSGAYAATSFGRVFAFGTARWTGSPHAASSRAGASPVVSIASTPDGRGYYVLSADGTVHSYSAPFYGSLAPGKGNGPAVAIVERPRGSSGYYVATAGGSVFAFGPGEKGRPVLSLHRPSAPVVGMAVDPSTGGLWIALEDGQVLGHRAPVLGSATCRLSGTAVTGVAAQGRTGYVLVTTTGRAYSFGGARQSAGSGPTASSCASSWRAQHSLGFYPGQGNARGAMAKFRQLQGTLHRPVGYLSEFTDMRSPSLFAGSAWGLLAKPGGLQTLSPKPMLVLSVPLGFGGIDPSPGAASSNFAAVSSGSYDSYYKYVAGLLVKAGYPDAVVRIGWEFDAYWYPWSARYDPKGYVQAYRHVVTVFRKVSPSFKFDWSGTTAFQNRWSRYWPGRSYVDMVGLDIYDQGFKVPYNPFTGGWLSPSLAWSRARAHLTQADRFAVRHGVPMSLPEWGLSQGGSQLAYSHGGDNPLFVRGIYAWLSASRPTGPGSVAFASYFDAAPSAQQGSFRLSAFPAAKKTFVQLFG